MHSLSRWSGRMRKISFSWCRSGRMKWNCANIIKVHRSIKRHKLITSKRGRNPIRIIIGCIRIRTCSVFPMIRSPSPMISSIIVVSEKFKNNMKLQNCFKNRKKCLKVNLILSKVSLMNQINKLWTKLLRLNACKMWYRSWRMSGGISVYKLTTSRLKIIWSDKKWPLHKWH